MPVVQSLLLRLGTVTTTLPVRVPLHLPLRLRHAMMSNNDNESGRLRFSLTTLFAFVTFCAIAAMALRTGDWLWARVIFTLTLAIHLSAIFGIVYRTGGNRAFWLGFAVFGWTYLILAFIPTFRIAEHHLFGKQVNSYLKEYTPEASSGLVIESGDSRFAVFSFPQIIYSLSAWLFAMCGGLIGWYFYYAGRKHTSRMQSGDPG